MSRKGTSSQVRNARVAAGASGSVSEEVPELDEHFFAHARVRSAGKVIRDATGTLSRRGRPPKGTAPKIQQTLRLSPEVIEHFRSIGAGWQARIDDVLMTHVRNADSPGQDTQNAIKQVAAGLQDNLRKLSEIVGIGDSSARIATRAKHASGAMSSVGGITGRAAKSSASSLAKSGTSRSKRIASSKSKKVS